MSTQLFRLTSTSVQHMIAKRKILRLSDDKSFVKLHIQSGGNMLQVTDKSGQPVLSSNGQPLMKVIYNVSANSHVAMLNPRNQEILKSALEAEKQGDEDAAHAAYNDYLNKIQVSFNILINPGSSIPKFAKNDLIKGTVQVVTTDNGQLITLEKVSAVEALDVMDTPKFTLNQLLGVSDEGPAPEEIFTPTTEATA